MQALGRCSLHCPSCGISEQGRVGEPQEASMEKQEPGEERQCLGQGRRHHDDQQMRMVDVEEGREPAVAKDGLEAAGREVGSGLSCQNIEN